MSAPCPEVEPFSLEVEVYLTNRCNMDCSYCSSRYLIHEKEAKGLTFDQLKQAVDVISSDKYIQDKFNGKVQIDFKGGGEPLLEFELVKKTILYMRTKEIDFEIGISTNGTLLTENRMDFFARNNVEVCISLDGYRRVNDLYRKFRNNKKKSVFDVVMNNLKKGLINKRYTDHVHVGTTFTSQTIDSLPDVVKFFRHDVGFKEMKIGLEIYEIWSQAGIKRLRNVLRGLKSRFLTALEHKMDIKDMEAAFSEFRFSQYMRNSPHVWHKGTDYNELATNPIALFYDGYFYSSDFVVKPPLERKYRVGDIEHGIDFKKVKTIASSPEFTEISRKCEYQFGLLSPTERYYWGVVHKFTPDKLNELLENTSQVNRVFIEEMDCYIRLQRIYERLVMTTSFGDFAHLPKYRSGKEIKSLRLAIRNDSDIAGLREGVDHFLYSPGNGKKLILEAMDNTQTARDVVEGMALYVLMKAGYLKKRIKLMVACEAGDTSAFDENSWRYLNEHGVRVGTCFAGESPRNQPEAGPPLAEKGDLV